MANANTSKIQNLIAELRTERREWLRMPLGTPRRLDIADEITTQITTLERVL